MPRTADRASVSTCLHELNQSVAITDYAHDRTRCCASLWMTMMASLGLTTSR
ncbi:hypothetical protein I553_9236 [Mycobacterium xenopi 4042]|uniref:Uncharacterized protein n=1 Tax=Mycobacterium xenopi 4042 TaxID=1299334 RepID=X7ZZ81_MYCXE|nr:hypothetical protein I553_3526 [Mycobacterium xenopi 4042]EUA27903.1 hypothetical protein I553_9236 [Mycobacterium xenopi 4042]EUA44189.1 hypothetical protein I552_3961 [Mycobacterium xenopi 3993]